MRFYWEREEKHTLIYDREGMGSREPIGLFYDHEYAEVVVNGLNEKENYNGKRKKKGTAGG